MATTVSSGMSRFGAVAGLAVLLAACSQGEVVEPPPTTASAPTTVAEVTTTIAPAAAPTSTVEPRTLPSYEVVERISGTEGDTLVVLLPEGDYDDLDVENLMAHLVDEFGPVAMHVVDVSEAVPLVLDEGTSADDPVLADHYLARLENGNRVVFMGPLSEFGWYLIGS